MDMREVFTIDGRRFSNMAGFYDEVERVFTARVPQVTVIDPRIPEKAKLRVDCILSHCGPSSVVRKIDPSYGSDQLTDFLETVNQRCQFTYWFFGHYHDNRIINDRYILQWEQISGLEI